MGEFGAEGGEAALEPKGLNLLWNRELVFYFHDVSDHLCLISIPEESNRVLIYDCIFIFIFL